MITIKILNNYDVKLSPYAFGTLFTNVNEYTARLSVDDTFAAIGVYKNMLISDINGYKYKIKNILQTSKGYTIEIYEL